MSKPLRVVMIIQGYYPRVGGAERQLADLAPLLQAQGVEVYVLTRRYPGLLPFEVVHGVPVHRLPIPGPKPVASLTFTLAALPLLGRLRPDIIHAHELLSPATTAVLGKTLLSVPVIVTLLRGGYLGDITKIKSRPGAALRLTLLRRCVDAFIAISCEIDAELAEIGIPPERRPFIPNGVDTERFAPPSRETRRARRAALGLPDGPVALFIGRLVAEKRVDHLLDLWPGVRAAHPEAQLLVLGTGEEEAVLRRAAGAGVRFAGEVADVAPYLQAADLFLLPSATEGLSIALLEAMAAGLPAVVTAVGGAPDLIAHGENGWLVPPDDPGALRAAILALLDAPDRRTLLGRRARERVELEYALPIIASRLRSLYDRLLRKEQPSRLPSIGRA